MILMILESSPYAVRSPLSLHPSGPIKNDVGAVQVAGRRQRARGASIDAGTHLANDRLSGRGRGPSEEEGWRRSTGRGPGRGIRWE